MENCGLYKKQKTQIRLGSQGIYMKCNEEGDMHITYYLVHHDMPYALLLFIQSLSKLHLLVHLGRIVAIQRSRFHFTLHSLIKMRIVCTLNMWRLPPSLTP